MNNDNFKAMQLIADATHNNARQKGFWDNPKERGTRLMLITSELGEALDADREGRHADLEDFEKRLKEVNNSITTTDSQLRQIIEDENFISLFKSRVKDTYGDELADALIRIFDTAGGDNIQIAKYVELKMRYNATRERMHGKAY